MTRSTVDYSQCEALRDGDVEAIRRRVKEDPAYLETCDRWGSTPLMAAVGFGQQKLVRVLIELGADPNVSDDGGCTCLFDAIDTEAEASGEMIAILIAEGADICGTGINGWRPLHLAAARGYIAKAQQLLDAGANVNQRAEDDGETPLWVAAAGGGDVEMVQFLLDRGADPTLADETVGQTPLEWAEECSKNPAGSVLSGSDIVEMLQEEGFVSTLEAAMKQSGLPPDQLDMMKQFWGEFDAEEYDAMRAAHPVDTGSERTADYAEVIRILTEKMPQ